MASAITPSLRAGLERLKHAGAVNGLCLAWRRQVLVSLMPYEEFRVEQLVQSLNDARDHFQGNGQRSIESFWMAYFDVHVLCVFDGDCALIVLHVRPEEADFLNGAAKTFLHDAQLLIAAALGAGPAPAGESAEEEGHHNEESWLPQPPRLDPNQTNVIP
jgi:hypothetical protein